MYTVEVTLECSCFIKSDLVNNREFPTQEAAREAAMEMMEVISKTFCAKHRFTLIEEPLAYKIVVSSGRT